MLTYDIENHGNVPLYEYIYIKIKEDILSGRIKPGEKLPSKRALAQNLRVSVITVESAYAQLSLEGYIHPVQKRGYFVCKIKKLAPPPPSKMHKPVPRPADGRRLLDISTNSVTPEKFPFSVWAKLMRSVLPEYEDRLLQKIPNTGIYELRLAIAEHLYHFKGMDVSEDNIIIGAGTDYLYNILIQLFGKDKIYAIENPGHKNISHIYNSNGIKYNCIELDNNGMSADALKQSDSQIVHISPSHHYPTGITMPIARRHELLSWANLDSNRYIIEDDYDSEFRFTGRPVPSMQSISPDDKVIYINTFSKTLTPAIRISYMILPRSLMEKYKEKLGFYSCSVSAFEQFTLAKFISLGFFEKHINRMKNYYKTQRDYIIDSIKNSGLDNIKISEKDSGLHFLLHVDTELTDAQFKALLDTAGIRALMLSDYCTDPHPADSHTIIINYSGIDHTDFRAALLKLTDLIKTGSF